MQVRVGALQIARVSVGALGATVDDLNVFNLPFVFRDVAHMRKVIDGEIGRELFIGEATVKTHLIRAFAKLGVTDRTAAVTAAYASGLIELPRA